MKTESENWDSTFVEYFNNKKSKLKRDLSVLKTLGLLDLPKEAYILELFCGRGECQELLRDNGYANVFGCDISLRLVSQARTDCIVHACNSLRICYKSKVFDAVFINEGLHHLSDLADMEQFFYEVKRVMKQKGVFAFFEPSDTIFRTLASLAVFSPISKISRKAMLLKDIFQLEKKEMNFWLKNTPDIFRVLKETGFEFKKRYNTLIHMVSICNLQD